MMTAKKIFEIEQAANQFSCSVPGSHGHPLGVYLPRPVRWPLRLKEKGVVKAAPYYLSVKLIDMAIELDFDWAEEEDAEAIFEALRERFMRLSPGKDPEYFRNLWLKWEASPEELVIGMDFESYIYVRPKYMTPEQWAFEVLRDSGHRYFDYWIEQAECDIR
jgi:hypothetical protein